MSKILRHAKGTIVCCSNNHEVCEIVKDLHRGDVSYSQNFGNWRSGQVVPTKGTPLPILCYCGAPWIDGYPGRLLNTKQV